MNKQSVLYGVIGLLLGVIIAWGTAVNAVNGNHNGVMRMMGIRTYSNTTGMIASDDMTMSQMENGLEGKTGKSFDQTFLSEMILHHKAAVNMANSAKDNASHPELKDLAKDIIATQTKEIEQMQTWQKEWGYATTGDGTVHTMMNGQ